MILYAWWGYLIVAVLALLAFRCLLYDIVNEL